MRILNVAVVQKDGAIRLTFDCSKDAEERSLYVGVDLYHLPNISRLNNRAEKGEPHEDIVDEYNITYSREGSFKIQGPRGKYEYSNKSVSFTLPRNQSCALKLIDALSRYCSEQIMEHPTRFRHFLLDAPIVSENIVIEEKRIVNKSKFNLFGVMDKKVNVKKFSVQMDEYLTFAPKSDTTFFQAILDMLLKFEQMEGYEDAMNVVKSFSHKAITPEECEKTASLRLNVLVHVATDMIRNNKQKELTNLLKQMNDHAKDELYAPCLGEIADDKKKYTHDYSENKLLKKGDFRIREDGRMSLILTNNSEYLRLYAPGKKLQNTLEREMRHLGPFIFLEFAEDSDFDKEIIFTPMCSAYLKDLGLHLNEKYIASLLFTRNISGFFRNAKQANENEVYLHEEILAMIGEGVTNYPFDRGILQPLIEEMVDQKHSVKHGQAERTPTLGL